MSVHIWRPSFCVRLYMSIEKRFILPPAPPARVASRPAQACAPYKACLNLSDAPRCENENSRDTDGGMIDFIVVILSIVRTRARQLSPLRGQYVCHKKKGRGFCGHARAMNTASQLSVAVLRASGSWLNGLSPRPRTGWMSGTSSVSLSSLVGGGLPTLAA